MKRRDGNGSKEDPWRWDRWIRADGTPQGLCNDASFAGGFHRRLRPSRIWNEENRRAKRSDIDSLASLGHDSDHDLCSLLTRRRFRSRQCGFVITWFLLCQTTSVLMSGCVHFAIHFLSHHVVGAHSIFFRPSQFLCIRKTAALFLALFSGPAAARAILAGERPRMIFFIRRNARHNRYGRMRKDNTGQQDDCRESNAYACQQIVVPARTHQSKLQ